MQWLIGEALESEAIIEGRREMSVGKIVDKIVSELPHTEAEISEDQVRQADRDVEEIRLSEKLNATEENAVNIFGSTDDFSETGYILPDGTKLKMTDVAHPGERYYDHRAIARAYGETVDTDKNHGFNDSFGKYLEDFVEKGSIRFDAGDPNLDIDAGIQISGNVPLTRSQENAIRDFVEWKEEREEALASDSNSFYSMFGATPLKIHIDFGADSGYFAGSRRSNRERSISYSGNNINASRIIEDIRNYYRTGEIRQPSQISEFRYSEGYDTELKLHGRELRAFESARMNSIASLKAKFDIIPAKWYLTLGDRFYVFENTSMGDYTIRYRFKIDDVDQLNSFREEFRNAIVESTEVPDSWAKNLRLQRGNGGWHNASYGQPGNARQSYGLDGRKHYIDRTRDIQQSSRDSGSVPTYAGYELSDILAAIRWQKNLVNELDDSRIDAYDSFERKQAQSAYEDAVSDLSTLENFTDIISMSSFKRAMQRYFDGNREYRYSDSENLDMIGADVSEVWN